MPDPEQREPVLGSFRDDDYYRRRIHLHGKCFPVPIQLDPSESLRDAILRAVTVNGYRNTGIVSELAQARTFALLSACIGNADVAEIFRVFDVLGIRRDASASQQLLLSAGATGRGYVSFFGHRVRRSHVAASRRVSSRALAKSGVHKALWSLSPLGFDLDTGEVLLEHCPVCLRSLGWNFTSGPFFCDKCPAQQVDLRSYPQPLAKIRDFEALQFVVGCVDPRTSETEFDKFRGNPITRCARGDLFQFAVRIASALAIASQPPSAEIRLNHLELAGRALLHWPRSFLLLEDKIPSLQFQRFKRDQTLAGDIREKINTVLYCTSSPNFQSANRPSDTVQPDGGPTDGRDEHSVNVKSDRTRLSVENLRGLRAARDIAATLGLPMGEVLNLFEDGLLPELEFDALTEGGEPTVDAASFSLPQRLLGQQSKSPYKSGLSLATLRFSLDRKLSSNWAHILRAVLSGEIEVHCKNLKPKRLLSNMYVADDAAMRKIIEFEPRCTQDANSPLSRSELSMLFGKAPSVAAALIGADFLPDRPTKAMLAKLRESYVFGFEIKSQIWLQGRCPDKTFKSLLRSRVRRVVVNGISLWPRDSTAKFLGVAHAAG
ncbi:hypothetical protein ELH80_13780 [Rhizobium ruizarguesonis]|uniref:hypothetical protein n=1 Tax=Rhizobium ruizarguesonis TaxID=2081791 RepID=UPI00102F98A8|nr:hypothetical protein [Rhizobium ruizarguesonis]TAZ35365.1 hypothetical protein ELH80_13780 [Rhizobium ruizarguesonis]